jgi:hypothetical protein
LVEFIYWFWKMSKIMEEARPELDLKAVRL